MSYCIIIRGPLGVGKTTIAKKLAKHLNADYISIDSIMRKHKLDKADKELDCIPLKNFIKVNKIILPRIKKFIEKKKIVVLDGCFYHKKQIEHLKEILDYPQYVFTLKAPLELCIERDSNRKKTYGEKATKTVYKLVTKFDYGTKISMKKKSISEISEAITSYLP